MSLSTVIYNGYTFSEYSNISVNAVFQQDDAQRTILYHRYRLRVESTIYAGEGEVRAGQHFSRIRRQLTKQGRSLRIAHQGFGEYVTVNGGDGPRDVAFGPTPTILNWLPVGETNAVEVVWECEFCVPTCDDEFTARHTGIMSFNYGISFQIDKAGYTTRTISGHLQIAMTRVGAAIPDTADAYREVVDVPKPLNFERNTTWTLSQDKRRADFTIVDAEIRSPHAFPADVVSIRASHMVGWNRQQLAMLPQTIRATIELTQTAARGRSWQIFKAICEQRLGFALAEGSVFLEAIQIDEEMYGNVFNYSLSYRLFSRPDTGALASLFTGTGIGSDLAAGTSSSWVTWAASVEHLQSHRGYAGLEHIPENDTLVDLCTDPAATPGMESRYPQHLPTQYFRLCNEKPPADRSWVRYESWIETDEDVPTTAQVTMGKDDLAKIPFDPDNPDPTLGDSDGSAGVVRYVESQSGSIEISWRGYAERVGYPIPRPDVLTIGDVVLTRVGPAQFSQRLIAKVFCQPLYAAAWNQRYTVSERPAEFKYKDLVPYGENDDF